MKKVLLYSGGMDSYIISKLWKPDVLLYFDYGIDQNEQEKRHLPPETIIKKLPIGEFMESDGLNTIPLRNLIFSALAVNYGDVIAIGGLKSDLHYDKKPEFVRETTKLFNSVLNKERSARNVEVVVPYAEYTKTDLVVEYLKRGNNIEDLFTKTWSCHTPNGDKPCGVCQACKAKNKAIQEALERL